MLLGGCHKLPGANFGQPIIHQKTLDAWASGGTDICRRVIIVLRSQRIEDFNAFDTKQIIFNSLFKMELFSLFNCLTLRKKVKICVTEIPF